MNALGGSTHKPPLTREIMVAQEVKTQRLSNRAAHSEIRSVRQMQWCIYAVTG